MLFRSYSHSKNQTTCISTSLFLVFARLTKIAIWVSQQAEKSTTAKKKTSGSTIVGTGSGKVTGQEHKTPRDAARSEGAASKATNHPPPTQGASSKPGKIFTACQVY